MSPSSTVFSVSPSTSLRATLRREIGDLAIQVPHACLARVILDHRADRLLAEFEVVRREPVLLALARHEVRLGDLDLLLLRVARDAQHLHAVPQRRRDRVQHVGRADEEDLAQVERHLEVVVREGEVLLRIQHLEQGRGGIAAKIRAELVHLVEHEDGIVRAGALDALDDASGQRADVGATVAADLGLVPHAAERDADELAPHRAGDRAPQRGLAHAGRPREAEDRALQVLLQRAHGQVLEDAVLDLLQVEMVVVENLLGLEHVQLVLGLDGPGQTDQPVQVSACHGVLCGLRRHLGQAIQLLLGGLPGLFGHLGVFDLLLQLVDLGLSVVLLAQLALDRLHLLAQVVLLLRLAHLVGDLGLDAAGDLL